MDRYEWYYACDWTLCFMANSCISSPSLLNEGYSRDDLELFADDLEQKVQGDVDMDTIDWIWDRIAELSSNGKSYAEDYRPTKPEIRSRVRSGHLG